MKKIIEVEYRSLLSEYEFLRIRDSLIKDAKFLGNDNKDTFFYIWDDKVIKIVKNVDTLVTKMVLKPGRIGQQDYFHESEIELDSSMFEAGKTFCKNLFPVKVMYAFQFRKNFLYNGVEIALKYTESWGFHMEFEIMIEDSNEEESAKLKIKEVANSLGINLLNNTDLVKLTHEIESGINYGDFSNEKFPYKDFFM